MADRGRAGRFGFAVVAIVFAASCALILIPDRAGAAKELLLNGDLSKGSGEQPDDWRTEAWINEPSAWTSGWTHPPDGGPGVLEVNAIKPDDARWMQSLSLHEGWYYFSAEIRTEDVGMQATGATLSVMEDGVMSPELKGTTNWTRVGFFMHVGKKGADVEVAARVGGFGSLNTGKGFFRNISAIEIPAPPPGAHPVYDLEAIRKAAQPAPIGHLWTLVMTYALLAAVAYAGWVVFAQEPPKISRAQARREAKRAARR
jgi:hypothetical protein